MVNSILQFQTEGIPQLQEVFDRYSSDPTKVAEMVKGVMDVMLRLGVSIITEEWESYDELLHKNKDLRPGWSVVRRDTGNKITTIGTVPYTKTYFRNKVTGEYCYLVDRLLGFNTGERLTEDAVARILEEAVDSSYRKGGINVSIDEDTLVTKEAVMDIVHDLKFPKTSSLEEKRKVKTLYIDADEDHVALQYLDDNGELRDSKYNTYMPRLVYVYEGIDTESDRHQLIQVKYFGGGYEGSGGVKALWKAVYEYIQESYDEEELETIYVSGDGAEWIQTGAQMHAKAKFVLDKYHMHQYIVTATSHLMDSTSEARSQIWRAINGKRKKDAEAVFDHILAITDKETKRNAVEISKKYILSHWPGIMNGVRNRSDNIQCSAEGHVSHVYSDRMSSRPLGWCKVGADKMSQLRVYKKNRESMLDLVRYQKEDVAPSNEVKEVICSASEVMASEAKNRYRMGMYADIPTYTIPYAQVRKKAAIRHNLWGL